MVMINVALLTVGFFQIVRSQDMRKGAIRSFPEFTNATMLTFDDGPHEIITTLILDILKSKNAKATFYIMGMKAELYPDIIKRMHREGHDVANHGWEHHQLTAMSPSALIESLNRTSHFVVDLVGEATLTIRPPWGKINIDISKRLLTTLGMHPVLWSLDSGDWRRPKIPVLIQDVISKTHRGEIILFHDINPCTLGALPHIIDGIRAKGLNFITLAQAIAQISISETKRI
jgi:peptidoglycan/xylan/chitin deacetylase (PgdA/CDA1 family)